MLIFTLFISLFTLVMITLIFKDASLVVIPYAYVILGVTVGLVPLLLFLRHFPHFYLRFLLITLYFIFVSILVEYAGLELNQWTFPGSHYLWQFNFFGYRIPVEEFIFYFVLSTPAFLAYYEYLDDDRK